MTKKIQLAIFFKKLVFSLVREVRAIFAMQDLQPLEITSVIMSRIFPSVTPSSGLLPADHYGKIRIHIYMMRRIHAIPFSYLATVHSSGFSRFLGQMINGVAQGQLLCMRIIDVITISKFSHFSVHFTREPFWVNFDVIRGLSCSRNLMNSRQMIWQFFIFCVPFLDGLYWQ